jgi:hypothetical protein
MYFLYSDISELEKIGEEVVIVYFKVLPNHLPGVTYGSHEHPQLGCAMVKIQTGHPLNTSQNHYHLSQLARLDIRGLYFFFFMFPEKQKKELYLSSFCYINNCFIPLGPLSRW